MKLDLIQTIYENTFKAGNSPLLPISNQSFLQVHTLVQVMWLSTMSLSRKNQTNSNISKYHLIHHFPLQSVYGTCCSPQEQRIMTSQVVEKAVVLISLIVTKGSYTTNTSVTYGTCMYISRIPSQVLPCLIRQTMQWWYTFHRLITRLQYYQQTTGMYVSRVHHHVSSKPSKSCSVPLADPHSLLPLHEQCEVPGTVPAGDLSWEVSVSECILCRARFTS